MAILDEDIGLGARGKYSGPRQNILDSSNSTMVPATTQQTPRDGVGFKGAIQKPQYASSIEEAIFGKPQVTQPAPATATARTTTVAQQPTTQPGPVASTPVTPATPNQQVASTDNIPPGGGRIINNDTGNVVNLGALSTSDPRLATQTAQGNEFGAYARDLLKQAQDLGDGSRPAMTKDGRILSNTAVGTGLVRAGLIKQAKALSDASNSIDALGIQRGNANVNAANVDSVINDRASDNRRRNAESAVNVDTARMQQTQAQNIADLQDRYLKEQDPAVRDQLAAQIAVLTGKTTEKFQPIMGKDDMGNPVYLGAFNARTGEATNMAGVGLGAGQQALPPGMVRQVGTSGGKPVYEDAQGKRFTTN